MLPTFFFLFPDSSMYRETLLQGMTSIIEPFLQAHGFELVELQVQQRKGSWFVRIFVDAAGGISLEDCQRLSREIGQLLEAEESLSSSYVLEVSSPGLDRPLRTARDFLRQHQRLVKVFLHTSWLEKRQYLGRVASVTEEHLVLEVPPEPPLMIPLSLIDHGMVELEFK